MKIEILLKRAHLNYPKTEIKELQEDIDKILTLVALIPGPKKDYQQKGKCILEQDNYEKCATKEELLAQRKMFTFGV